MEDDDEKPVDIRGKITSVNKKLKKILEKFSLEKFVKTHTKQEFEELLLSIIKTTQILLKQRQTKMRKKIKLEILKPSKSFFFDIPIDLEGN